MTISWVSLAARRRCAWVVVGLLFSVQVQVGRATKLGALSGTLLSNALAGTLVGTVSDAYRICATPTDVTFGIWTTIYLGLLEASIVPPYSDAAFERSMQLNRHWLSEWGRGDLRAANHTIHQLSVVNEALVNHCLATSCTSLRTYDTYHAWVQIASFLNDRIVRTHLDHQVDSSLRDAQRLLDALDGGRPGVRYAVQRARDGLRLGVPGCRV